MKKHTLWALISIVIFVVLYGLFVTQVNIAVESYSDIIVGTTFFFTLFIGYFITRQNDRYCAISDQLSSTDGFYSYLYRVSSLVPRVHTQVHDIVSSHYNKILETKNVAYHVKNPSDTITKLTAVFSSVSASETESPAAGAAWGYLFEVLASLQVMRKKILILYDEKLVAFQWSIVYILGALLIISFDFLPSTGLFLDVLKVCFGTAVFISLLLLKQLDDLTLFGDTAGMNSVRDVLSVLGEKDKEALSHQ